VGNTTTFARNHFRKSDKEAGGEHCTPSIERSHRGLHIAPKFGQLLTKRILEPLQLHALGFLHFSLLLHHSVKCSMHTLEIFFKILVFGGQRPFMMVNLCKFRPGRINLLVQLGISLFQLLYASSLLRPLGNPRFHQVQRLEKSKHQTSRTK
jgi:hypothetical protein